MIDIHAHILHDVDDGSSTIEDSIEMLRESKRQGVDKIILTPHFRDEFICEKSELESRFEELKAAVKDAGIDVELFLGREIRITRYFKEILKDNCMAGTKYVLAEFDFDEDTDIADTVYEIKRLGYRAIVAHIERYSYAGIEDACAVKDEGGLIQVNANSLFLKAGIKVRRKANALIRAGLCDFIASDIHSSRKNLMGKAYKKVAKRHGVKTAERLFNINAKKLIKI